MLGKILKEERLKNHLTIREVSNLLHMSSVYISDIENGKRTPTKLQTLEIFANLYKIELQTLLDLSKRDNDNKLLKKLGINEQSLFVAKRFMQLSLQDKNKILLKII